MDKIIHPVTPTIDLLPILSERHYNLLTEDATDDKFAVRVHTVTRNSLTLVGADGLVYPTTVSAELRKLLPTLKEHMDPRLVLDLTSKTIMGFMGVPNVSLSTQKASTGMPARAVREKYPTYQF